MQKGNFPFRTDTSENSRIGLLRKDDLLAGIWRWFEVPPFVCIHTIAAWEEGEDTVCLAVCRCGAGAAVLSDADAQRRTCARLCVATSARACPCCFTFTNGSPRFTLLWKRVMTFLVCRGDTFDLRPTKENEYYHNGPFPARYTIQLSSGNVECDYLCPQERYWRLEFPVVCNELLGQPQRFAYLGRQSAEEPMECAAGSLAAASLQR